MNEFSLRGGDFPPFLQGLFDQHVQDGTIVHHSAVRRDHGSGCCAVCYHQALQATT